MIGPSRGVIAEPVEGWRGPLPSREARATRRGIAAQAPATAVGETMARAASFARAAMPGPGGADAGGAPARALLEGARSGSRALGSARRPRAALGEQLEAQRPRDG